jgi:shikimate dehydrogenase
MKWYGLLGKTLKHSFSKAYFTSKFHTLGITDCYYENFELATINGLPQLLRDNPSIHGLNVTIPYKEEVLFFLDEQNDIVKEIKACNCIKILDGKLSGYNTDIIGFKKSLEKDLKPHHTKALILGTGGAAKAVKYALKTLGIHFSNVSRNRSETSITYEELDETILNTHHLIINTTPLGMFPKINEAPPIPYHLVNAKHLFFDLIYNPEETIFLKKAKEHGAKIINGSQMLILQAEESWRIWNS